MGYMAKCQRVKGLKFVMAGARWLFVLFISAQFFLHLKFPGLRISTVSSDIGIAQTCLQIQFP